MLKSVVFRLFFAAMFALLGLPAWAISPQRQTPIVKAVSQAAPAVVNITTSSGDQTRLEKFFGPGFDFFGDLPGRARKRASLGSGIIVDGKKGLVLTNAHVVAGSGEIRVHLQDGREFPARVKGINGDFDIAILEIPGASGLPSLPMGRSDDLLPGETVIAIGNPFGFSHTVTTGVISALNRAIRHNNGILTELIQTDAAINPGNSGGPLINLDGALVGINTAIDTRGEGIGFAIPIDKAKRVMAGLVDGARAQPLWLGIMGETPGARTARALGLPMAAGIMVTHVAPGSPAAKSDLQPGDVITRVNGADLRNWRDYINVLRNQAPGMPVTLDIYRDGKPMVRKAAPAPFDDKLARELMQKQWGFKASEKRGHVVVESAEKKGPANFLRKGDIIHALGDWRISGLGDLLEAYRRERMAPVFNIAIERNGRIYYGQIAP